MKAECKIQPVSHLEFAVPIPAAVASAGGKRADRAGERLEKTGACEKNHKSRLPEPHPSHSVCAHCGAQPRVVSIHERHHSV